MSVLKKVVQINVLGALAAKFSMSPLNISSLARASSLAFTQNESASSFVEWTWL